MARRTYTDDEMGAALAALVMCGGDVSKAARAAGVPRGTLMGWARKSSETVRQIQQVKELDLAAMMRNIAERGAGLTGLALDWIEAADEPGAVALANLAVLNRITGTAIDKMQLLTGEATERHEHGGLTFEEALVVARKMRILEGGKARSA